MQYLELVDYSWKILYSVLNIEHLAGGYMQKMKQDNEYGIGSNLCRLRKKKRYTQVEVVKRLELYGIRISRVTYNKMEHNYYSIRVKELLALSLIYECNLNEFYEGIKRPELI